MDIESILAGQTLVKFTLRKESEQTEKTELLAIINMRYGDVFIENNIEYARLSPVTVRNLESGEVEFRHKTDKREVVANILGYKYSEDEPVKNEIIRQIQNKAYWERISPEFIRNRKTGERIAVHSNPNSAVGTNSTMQLSSPDRTVWVGDEKFKYEEVFPESL